MLVSHSKNSA